MRDSLTELIQFIYSKGWSPGTGGNFSCLSNKDPFRLIITPSGVDKNTIKPSELLEVDRKGNVLSGSAKPSAETLLHIPIIDHFGASVVLHTHTVWNTLASIHGDQPNGHLTLSGFEMLKAFSGVTKHNHTERVPVIENSQDMPALAEELSGICKSYPDAHGVLLRGHGLYTWGTSFAEAKRHLECFEFLFEIMMRSKSLPVFDKK